LDMGKRGRLAVPGSHLPYYFKDWPHWKDWK
jgi:hypothetical protein